MSHYVVTGGAGFIGSAIVRGLLKEGATRVTVVDSLITGNEANLEEIRGRIDFHKTDIRDRYELEKLFHGADVVFHEAAIASVPRSITEPELCHEVNIDGTFNVLRAAKRAGVRRVLFAASSAAYGDGEWLPKTESMRPNPLSPYAAHKIAGEHMMKTFADCFGIETVSLRYFNVFGPRQDPTSPYSGVLSVFMKCATEGRSPTIFGDGEQSRDFIFVADVVELNLHAARATGVSGRVLNGGTGGRTTLNEAWAAVQRIEGLTLPAVYAAPRAGDVRHSQADVSETTRVLGYAAKTKFEDGLRGTLAWFKAGTAAPAR